MRDATKQRLDLSLNYSQIMTRPPVRFLTPQAFINDATSHNITILSQYQMQKVFQT